MENSNNLIKKPIGEDPLVGYDEHGQFLVGVEDSEGTVTFVYGKRDPCGVACSICGQGWGKLTGKEVMNQHRMAPWDDLVHMRCYEGLLATQELTMWHRIFQSYPTRNEDYIKLEINSHFKLPNQYNGGYNTPWYQVHVSMKLKDSVKGATLIMGMRRRVYSIECLPDYPEAGGELWLSMVRNELNRHTHNTHSFEVKRCMVHAHGDEEAKGIIHGFLSVMEEMLVKLNKGAA